MTCDIRIHAYKYKFIYIKTFIFIYLYIVFWYKHTHKQTYFHHSKTNNVIYLLYTYVKHFWKICQKQKFEQKIVFKANIHTYI